MTDQVSTTPTFSPEDYYVPEKDEYGLPRPNVPLLRKVLEHVKAHPEEWDQTVWVGTESFVAAGEQVPQMPCGTRMCIAGHAVAMTEGIVFERTDLTFDAVWISDEKGWGTRVTGEPASGESFSVAGQRLLGLTGYEAECLFSGGNELGQVERFMSTIAERAGEQL